MDIGDEFSCGAKFVPILVCSWNGQGLIVGLSTFVLEPSDTSLRSRFPRSESKATFGQATTEGISGTLVAAVGLTSYPACVACVPFGLV